MANRFGDEPVEVNRFGDPVYSPEKPQSKGFFDHIKDAGAALVEGLPIQQAIDIGGVMNGPVGAMKAGQALSGMAKGVAAIPGQVWDSMSKSGDAMIHGDVPNAAYHLAGAFPVIGPPAQQVSNDIAAGDYGKAVGHTAALVGPFAAPEALAAAREAPVLPKMVRQANPKVSAALDYLESKGVPGNLAARSDNPVVKFSQKAADTTPIGGIIAERAARETKDALRAEAADLVNRATPDIAPDTHYDSFRAAEADPANLRTVKTGTKIDPESQAVLDAEALNQFHAGFNGLDAAQRGAVVNALGPEFAAKRVPVMQDIPMATRVGDLKPQLQKVFDQMQWGSDLSRSSSSGYSAMKKILDGPDYVSASDAELGLSGLKELAREGKGRSQGLAKMLIPKLQATIDDSVATAGPNVVKALQEGRVAAARQVGADWLTKTFEKAQNEGGFHREAGIWADWGRLKPNEKVTMFRDPKLINNIDQFMLGAKRLAENPNPSGSGVLAWIAGQGAMVYEHPVTGVKYIIGGAALSKLMHSTTAVRALTDGMRISTAGAAVPAARAAAVADRILKSIGTDEGTR
jgi:hypothetical protein